MKCAYCGKAIRKSEQKAASYVIGIGDMHPACKTQYDTNRLDDIVAGRNVRYY